MKGPPHPAQDQSSSGKCLKGEPVDIFIEKELGVEAIFCRRCYIWDSQQVRWAWNIKRNMSNSA